MVQTNSKAEKIILGIDPGTNVMGYGIIRVQGKKAEMLALGVIDLRKYGDHDVGAWVDTQDYFFCFAIRLDHFEPADFCDTILILCHFSFYDQTYNPVLGVGTNGYSL